MKQSLKSWSFTPNLLTSSYRVTMFDHTSHVFASFIFSKARKRRQITTISSTPLSWFMTHFPLYFDDTSDFSPSWSHSSWNYFSLSHIQCCITSKVLRFLCLSLYIFIIRTNFSFILNPSLIPSIFFPFPLCTRLPDFSFIAITLGCLALGFYSIYLHHKVCLCKNNLV